MWPTFDRIQYEIEWGFAVRKMHLRGIPRVKEFGLAEAMLRELSWQDVACSTSAHPRPKYEILHEDCAKVFSLQGLPAQSWFCDNLKYCGRLYGSLRLFELCGTSAGLSY
jgi:hypothetical protein